MKLHKSIFELEIWQRVRYFFVDDLYQILSLFQNLLGLWHSYLGPQPIWTSPWQEWKSLLMNLKNCTTVFFELEIWQRVRYFFVDDLYQILSLFQNLLGLWHSYLGPQPIWTSPWQEWKSLLMNLKNCTTVFFELEIWQRVRYFFVDDLYQIISLFQNLLGLWQSYLGSQPIWKSPWQDWKSLFMKLHKSIFWARNLTTC